VCSSDLVLSGGLIGPTPGFASGEIQQRIGFAGPTQSGALIMVDMSEFEIAV
jgi:hypothetical protein